MVKETKVDKTFIRMMDEYRKPKKGAGLLEACSESVVVFAEKMLGFRLYAWQVDFLTRIQKAIDNRKTLTQKEFVAITSRQIGKSTAIAVLGIWAAVFNKYPGTISNNTIFGITSASDVQAKKLLHEMKKMMSIGDRFIKEAYVDDDGKPLFGEKFFSDLLNSNEPNNTTTITFNPYDPEVHGDYVLKGSKSGSVIKSYPPTSSVLGETFTVVVIDEVGKTDKISDQFIIEYIYPTGNSTSAIRIYTSTPWVSSGYFYRMVNPHNSFSDSSCDVVLYTIEAIKIEAPDYYNEVTKIVKQMNADGKTDEVQRAYYCRFVKGEQSYFDPKKVYTAFTDKPYDMYSHYLGPCDLGVDFGGQVKSKTVLTLSEINGDKEVRRLYHKTYEVGKDDRLIEDIEDLYKVFNIQRIIPDDCPQGDYMIRKMKEKGWNVQPMNFRAEKVKKYGAFRSTLNRGKIFSYTDDDLKTEMLALEFNHQARQSYIQHAPGYSDDLIDSFLLSTYFFVTDDTGVKVFDFEDDEEGGECPQCDSQSVTMNNLKRICRGCGYEWEITDI